MGVQRGSRGLLLPGPQPPLSHLGATLLRHVVVTGLRYSFYHLGLPLPVTAPTRIERLRLALDTRFLDDLLSSTAGGAAVAQALADPAGSDDGESGPVGAVFFHRLRMRLRRRRSPSAVVASLADSPGVGTPRSDSRTALESLFRERLSACLPLLNEAMLGEILGALARRRRRASGRATLPCFSPSAAAFVANANPGLERLGALDPHTPSWAEELPAIDLSASPEGAPPADRRGEFRETYRATLDCLRPTLSELGRRAHEVGVATHPDDLFFLPMELIGDLTLPNRPGWLEGAVLRNRGEYFGLRQEADAELQSAWLAAPLHPLP